MSNKFTEVANKITNIKSDFAEAITAKGVETLPSASFGDMISNVGKITGGGGAVVYDDWTKPYDWPDIEAEPLEENEIARILYCDKFNNTPEEINLTCSQWAPGTIDWGDGTELINFSANSYPGTKYKHTFDTNGGVYCESLGCKVYIVKIISKGGNIPVVSCGKNSATYKQILESGLLWFYGKIGYGSFSNLFNNTYSNAKLCQRVHIANRFNRSYAVQSILNNLHGLTSFKYDYVLDGIETYDLFSDCFSLKKAPGIKTNGGAYYNRKHFIGCHSLMEVGTITLSKDITFEIGDSTCKPPLMKINFAYDEAKPPVFTQTTPIKLNYTQLNADDLNKLMTQLPDGNGKTLDLQYNPGSATCDTSIATAKNWTVLI